MQIKANGILLEVEEYGPPDAPPLILIRGLGSQLIHWPENFVQGFVDAGYRTIIFDNRDIGLSQHCPLNGVSGKAVDILAAANRGEVPKPAYHLDDMANDVVGLMDALDIARAHIFCISLGGVVGQILAIDHPDRLLSATLVMTSSRLHSMGILPHVLSYPADRNQAQDNWVAGNAFWGSPDYPMTEAEIRAEAAIAWDRGWTDEGENRQLLAVINAEDRQDALTRVNVPCFVIHGANDPLIRPDAGREIAALIPDARLEVIAGMGHVISPLLAPKIVALVDDFIKAQDI